MSRGPIVPPVVSLAIDLRYCIPDSASGTGTSAALDLYVDGVYRQSITLDSAQSWLYETSTNYDGNSNDPSSGYAHKFYDDKHFFIQGSPVPQGARIHSRPIAENSIS